MVIKGVGIGRGVAVGPVIRMAAALPEPSDAPRADSVSAESEIERVTKSLALVNADLNRRAEEAANGDEGAKQLLRSCRPSPCSPPTRRSRRASTRSSSRARPLSAPCWKASAPWKRCSRHRRYQGERAADLHDVGQRVIAT